MQYFSASFQFDQIGVQSGVSEQNFAVIQIPDSVLEGDDASQREVCTLLLQQEEESPNITSADSYSENETGSSQLNETLRHSMSDAASCATVTQECV